MVIRSHGEHLCLRKEEEHCMRNIERAIMKQSTGNKGMNERQRSRRIRVIR